MKCDNCHKIILDDSEFCLFCGNKINHENIHHINKTEKIDFNKMSKNIDDKVVDEDYNYAAKIAPCVTYGKTVAGFIISFIIVAILRTSSDALRYSDNASSSIWGIFVFMIIWWLASCVYCLYFYPKFVKSWVNCIDIPEKKVDLPYILFFNGLFGNIWGFLFTYNLKHIKKGISNYVIGILYLLGIIFMLSMLFIIFR